LTASRRLTISQTHSRTPVSYRSPRSHWVWRRPHLRPAALRTRSLQPELQLIWEFNISCPRTDWLLDATYTGSRGSQLLWNIGFNQLPVADLALGSQLLQTVKNPFFGIITNNGPLNTATTQLRYLLAPIHSSPESVGAINQVQLPITTRSSFASRNVSHAIWDSCCRDSSSNNTGNFNGNGTQQDYNNRHGDWSLSTFDVSRRLVASFVYNVPFGKGKQFGAHWNRAVDSVLGGWRANGIITMQTGIPLALSASNVGNIFNAGERPNNNGAKDC
jgi:hypothetical protein